MSNGGHDLCGGIPYSMTVFIKLPVSAVIKRYVEILASIICHHMSNTLVKGLLSNDKGRQQIPVQRDLGAFRQRIPRVDITRELRGGNAVKAFTVKTAGEPYVCEIVVGVCYAVYGDRITEVKDRCPLKGRSWIWRVSNTDSLRNPQTLEQRSRKDARNPHWQRSGQGNQP